MLSEPITINNLEIANRFVRSATCDWMADEKGHITENQLDLYGALSQGQVGLIISGHMYVREEGHASPGMIGIHTDECVAGLTRLAEKVHNAGPAKVVAQINHGGRAAKMRFDHGDMCAPSAVPMNDRSPAPRAFETDEIPALAQAYGEAARRAIQAGFDAVQIHGAHGYLISQFLSPITNKREDEFGGSLENRARFLHLVYDGVRASVGDSVPVLIKLGSFDGQEGGLTLDEGVQVGTWLEAWGLDAIEISGGIGAGNSDRGSKAGEKEALFLEQARAFKKALSISVITVNGFRSLSVMQRALDEGDADMVAMCRPFIREPGLAADFLSGDKQTADCISCNGCFKTTDGKLKCVLT